MAEDPSEEQKVIANLQQTIQTLQVVIVSQAVEIHSLRSALAAAQQS